KKEEKKEEKDEKGKFLRREFAYTEFQKMLILPDNIEKDKIEAKTENGVLTITIPKKELPAPTGKKQIEVK
ncbi:MAG: Hsp20/alpha crystallin family protein, partial [Bacteroidales bacterium]